MISARKKNNTTGKDRNWTQYFSYGIQLMATIAVGLYIGYWIDKIMMFPVPLLIWIFPTALLVYMLVKLVKDFSKKKNK